MGALEFKLRREGGVLFDFRAAAHNATEGRVNEHRKPKEHAILEMGETEIKKKEDLSRGKKTQPQRKKPKGGNRKATEGGIRQKVFSREERRTFNYKKLHYQKRKGMQEKNPTSGWGKEGRGFKKNNDQDHGSTRPPTTEGNKKY